VEPETRTLAKKDQPGEIGLSSPSVAQGYWNKPELSAETFGGFLADTDAGPYLRTGDLGFNRSGQLYITGRIKELIILRGKNYHPHDIELSMKNSDAILGGAGAAFSLEEEGEERLAVVQELRRGFKDENLDVVYEKMLAALFQDHGITPGLTVFVRQRVIPRTTSGKIRRSETRVQYLTGQLRFVRKW